MEVRNSCYGFISFYKTCRCLKIETNTAILVNFGCGACWVDWVSQRVPHHVPIPDKGGGLIARLTTRSRKNALLWEVMRCLGSGLLHDNHSSWNWNAERLEFVFNDSSAQNCKKPGKCRHGYCSNTRAMVTDNET